MKDLINSLDETVVDRFGQLVLFNENLLKLGKLKLKSQLIIFIKLINFINTIKGYSFQQDSKKLAISFPKFRHRFVSEFEEDVINIDEVVNNFQKKWQLFPADEPASDNKAVKAPQRQSKGLSELTRKCFGKPLNKSECLSNWDSRPLRPAQLRYAALDAFVLIQIHDFIQNRIKTLGATFDYTSKKMCF